MADDAFRERLWDLAREKNDDAWKRARDEAERIRSALDKVRDLSDDGAFAKNLNAFCRRLSATERSPDCDMKWPRGLREALVQFFQLPRYVFYDEWRVVENPDPAKSDEENLVVASRRSWSLFDFDLHDDFAMRKCDVQDAFWMFGKLASKMHSAFLPRIVQLLVDCDKALGRARGLAADEAKRLVDEFASCWELAMKEILLRDANEKQDIWPQRPVRKDTVNEWIGRDVAGEDADEATEESRRQAWRVYRHNVKGLMEAEEDEEDEEDEFAWLHASRLHVSRPTLPDLVNEFTHWTAEAEKGALSLNDRDEAFYALLERVLSLDLDFSYTAYISPDSESEADEDAICSEGWCSEETPESKCKAELVAALDRYLAACSDLAEKYKSQALQDVNQCRTLLARYPYGRFFEFDEPQKTQAAADLATFVDGLKRIRPALREGYASYRQREESNQQIIVALSPPPNSRDDVIALIRHLYRKSPACSSWLKTVNYVRDMKDETNPDFKKCAAAQAVVKGLAKGKANGEDGVWRSIFTQARTKKKTKSRTNAAPGPVPILDKGI